MEIELKYLIGDGEKADEIWRELKARPDAVSGSGEEKMMHAVYFDGADGRLAKEKIAVRVRREGGETVATVKWEEERPAAQGAEAAERLPADPALHVRPELNIPVMDEAWFFAPPSDLFGETEIGRRICQIMGDEPLLPMMETKFLRRLIRVRSCGRDGAETVCEAAVDTGAITAAGGSEPICELEIELLKGDEKELMKLGGRMEAAYGLRPGTESKFARGKALRSEKNGGGNGAAP